ncbi:MAG: AMP-binding protein [Sphingomonadales bacterium]|nr:AMP-binding protein [Sphingomonadales bacterium]
MTSFEQEKQVQEAWRLKPGPGTTRPFDRLLANEFLPSAERRRRRSAALKGLVDFAMAQTAYYAEQLNGLGENVLSFDTPDSLAELPELSKTDVQLRRDELMARRLPAGQKLLRLQRSSGSTGPPTEVAHTNVSGAFVPVIKQREYRWFRFDPTGVMASIRTPSQLPQVSNRPPPELGEVAPLPYWPYVGNLFETGKAFGFSYWNGVDDQRDWLNDLGPDYLTTYPEALEHLAFASIQTPLVRSFKGLHAISEMMTPGMAQRIEAAFGAPVEQNYGLTEVGIVAVKCREGGRYHAHDEFAVVEIVDDDGQPVAPGETGRVLVTCLANLAMPLIRYDTGDLATAVSGDCPCGRTLPSFGPIVGRYIRLAYLPEGTIEREYVLRDALDALPPDMAAPLRKFQIQHFLDGGFELRLVTTEPLSEALVGYFSGAWEAALGPEPPPLKVIRVDDLAPGPGGKFQEFMSEFMPAPDQEAEPPS